MTHLDRLNSALAMMVESEDRLTVHCGAGQVVTVSRQLLGLTSSLPSIILSTATDLIIPDLPASHLGHISSILTTGTAALSRREMKDNYELVENAALMGLNIEHLSFIRIIEDHIEKKQQMLEVEEPLGSNEEKYKTICEDEKYPKTESAFDHYIKEDPTVYEDVKSIVSEPIENFTRPSLNSEHSSSEIPT